MISWSLTLVLTAAAILPPLAVYLFYRRGKHPVATWLVATAAIAAHIAAWQVISNAAAAWLLIGYEILGPIFGLGVLVDLFSDREE